MMSCLLSPYRYVRSQKGRVKHIHVITGMWLGKELHDNHMTSGSRLLGHVCQTDEDICSRNNHPQFLTCCRRSLDTIPG